MALAKSVPLLLAKASRRLWNSWPTLFCQPPPASPWLASLSSCGRISDVSDAYTRVIAARPGDAVSLSDLGGLFADQGRIADACECHYRAARTARSPVIHSNLLLVMNYGGFTPEQIFVAHRRSFQGTGIVWSLMIGPIQDRLREALARAEHVPLRVTLRHLAKWFDEHVPIQAEFPTGFDEDVDRAVGRSAARTLEGETRRVWCL